MTSVADPNPVSLSVDTLGDGTLILVISGRLDMRTTGGIWREVTKLLDQRAPPRLVVDAYGLTYCDGAGIGLLLELEHRQRTQGGELRLEHLHEEFKRLLELFESAAFDKTREEQRSVRNIPHKVGETAEAVIKEMHGLVAFVGQLSVALFYAVRHPLKMRWRDALLVAEAVGVDATPIVGLIGFLMGLIMAFQAAVAMRQFGADIFVANLVGLSMLRELGPLMTAVVLAGRSGSAFAAELGTMKVNEEIDALTTMGLDPVRFLVVPRVIAAVLMTPLLTVFADFSGLLGGGVVMYTFGIPSIGYINQLTLAVSHVDFLGGLTKAFVFGILVAAVGCMRGLQTGVGASAVGVSTTRAVVSGIILIALADGAFAVVYYYLGI
jgi:conserved hypothetical integral membrane protein